MKRTLSLRREHLAELSSDELAAVAGGRAGLPTLPVDYCLTLSCPQASCSCCTASASC